MSDLDFISAESDNPGFSPDRPGHEAFGNHRGKWLMPRPGPQLPEKTGRLRSICVLLVALATLPGCFPATNPDDQTVRGVTQMPYLCLPCGEGYTLVDSTARFEEVSSELEEKCGESHSPAAWRKNVEQAGVEFETHALVCLNEVIGTGGEAGLVLKSPMEGVLEARIEWRIPEGPARPIATAACFCFAVDKAIFTRVDVAAGPRTVVPRGPDVLSLEISP